MFTIKDRLRLLESEPTQVYFAFGLGKSLFSNGYVVLATDAQAVVIASAIVGVGRGRFSIHEFAP